MKWVEVECVAEEVEGPLIERLLSLEVRAKQEDRAAAISECLSLALPLKNWSSVQWGEILSTGMWNSSSVPADGVG